MHRLPQGVPRTRLGKLGPEQREQQVPSLEGSRCRQREVHQQRDALRLHENRAHFAALLIAKIESTERVQAEHVGAGIQITPRTRDDNGRCVAWPNVRVPCAASNQQWPYRRSLVASTQME